MKKIIFVIILLTSFLIISCIPVADNTVENNQIEIEGEIKELNEIGNSILVDSTHQSLKGLVWISIKDTTSFSSGVSEEFAVGNYVKIKIDGPVMESYPMQAKAGKIIKNESS